ncbi:hypothetical protein [Endozoicomonas atrinae]|uniref:hypothetical protein n=1 Tax=Endozoicomonas atrinae TaxID=1333660 RepID=UPI003B001183
MDRLTLNSVSNGSSNFQGTPSAESGATGQAFSRMVAEVGQPVTNHDITDQSTSSDNQRYLNPKKKWLNDFIVQNPTSDNDPSAIPAAMRINHIEPLKNNQVPEYIPENNPFSIYSITRDVQSTSQYAPVVDTKLYQPLQIPNQYCNDTFSKPESPTASDDLGYTVLKAHTVTHSLLQGASCGETSVNFSSIFQSRNELKGRY